VNRFADDEFPIDAFVGLADIILHHDHLIRRVDDDVYGLVFRRVAAHIDL